MTAEYPKEDKCRVCGKHLGYILHPVGEAVALGICEECRDKQEEKDN